MDDLISRLARLSSAEEFLDFFGVEYSPRVVDVNRLHILKRFRQYLRATEALPGDDGRALFAAYRSLLARAYDDFVRSTPAREKVFKVFQDADGRRVPLDALRADLARRRAASDAAPATVVPARPALPPEPARAPERAGA